MRIDISLSTDFRAFSITKESLARATWHLRTVRSLVFFSFFFVRYRALSFQKEKREGLARDSLVLTLKKVTLTERQTCFLNVNLLLSRLGVWAG